MDARFFWQGDGLWLNIPPVGWIGDWHPSPSLQWVVSLSGQWLIETQIGKRVEMVPGDIHWEAGVETTLDASRAGRRPGQIGDMPCVQMMVQFSDAEV
ncbi:MAG: hypothetical protein JHD35_06320 [Sphingopyxis sp.]|jgi:hypothetical protein|nr:hypothetical protein [Sphingopyxis sp.]OHC95530.1 MAG: hypothetical protein A2095_03885 [Sphingomonadales bacterium GWF1_63_6]|tara:strand:- start:1515 stop:1808 length:294 start_codon:yes stop_codon:yes gene_type:complete